MRAEMPRKRVSATPLDSQGDMNRNLDGFEFGLVGQLEFELDSTGRPAEYVHHLPSAVRPNRYAAGPFCGLALPAAPSEAGVYAITILDEIKYMRVCGYETPIWRGGIRVHRAPKLPQPWSGHQLQDQLASACGQEDGRLHPGVVLPFCRPKGRRSAARSAARTALEWFTSFGNRSQRTGDHYSVKNKQTV